VVEVRVGENDVVDGGGVDGKPGPVLPPQGGQTLIKAGVNEDPGVGAFEEEATTGDSPGGAQEGQRGVRHGVTRLIRLGVVTAAIRFATLAK